MTMHLQRKVHLFMHAKHYFNENIYDYNVVYFTLYPVFFPVKLYFKYIKEN